MTRATAVHADARTRVPGSRLGRWRADRSVDWLEPVASAVQKLAVMLSAGVAPASSWTYLAESSSRVDGASLMTGGVPEAVARRVSVGEEVSSAILAALPALPTGSSSAAALRRRHRVARPARDPTEQAWRALAAAWSVATGAGAPLAPTLVGFAASLRSIAQIQRDLAVALAAPVATARLVMILPVVAVLFGVALGFDTVGVLTTTAPGLLCLTVGIALMLAARGWNRRMCAAAAPKDLAPGLEFDLIAIAVSGGASTGRAVASVRSALARCSLDVADTGQVVDGILDLSRRAGIPAAELLRSEADERRRSARSEGERRAAALGVKLMLPLGVCVLPAFMLLGVAPLLISVISSTVGRF
ncbi:MAG: hypothetical protein RI885_1021 [Actinomycetota bacterium]|jgi:tight adherence protein B